MPLKCDISSAIYPLLFLASAISLILGALSWSRTETFFLPFPTWIPAVATLLPPVTLLTLAIVRTFVRNNSTNSAFWPQTLQIINHLHNILSTIIATIALAYLFPDTILSCRLEQQWQAFFQQKDSHAIRSIQDRFQCCGFRSIHDRAWPFKDREHGDNACEVQLGYRRSCFTPWREMQQGTGWMVFAAAVFVWAVKIGFVQFSHRRTAWMNARFPGNVRDPQQISGPGLEESNGDAEADGEARRTLLPQSRPGHDNVWDVD